MAERSYPKELDVGVNFGQLGQHGVDLLALFGPPSPEVYCKERTDGKATVGGRVSREAHWTTAEQVRDGVAGMCIRCTRGYMTMHARSKGAMTGGEEVSAS